MVCGSIYSTKFPPNTTQKKTFYLDDQYIVWYAIIVKRIIDTIKQ